MNNNFTEQLNNVKKTLLEQKEKTESLSALVSAIEENDLSKENDKLQTEIIANNQKIEKLSSELSQIKQEHETLKKSLFDQVLKQKNEVITQVNKEVESYFKTSLFVNGKNIIAVQSDLKQKSDKLHETLKTELIADKKSFEEQITSLNKSIEEEIKKLHEKNKATFNEEKKNIKDEINKFASSPLTEEQIKRTVISNSAEVNAGSKVANIAGMFLILLGVIFGAQYTYSVILSNSFLKSIFAFAIGIIFLILGEWQNKKSNGSFSTGLTAGGIGILFASTAISFFNLHVISSITAATICILVSACAFYLSLRYNSQLIGIFALIGGYLPITSADSTASTMYGVLVYFLILNALSLFISKEKKWLPLNFISFFFNSIAIFTIILFNSNYVTPSFTLTYVMINFIVYCLIVLINPFIKKVTLKTGDIVLLTLNTVFHCSFVYILIWIYHLNYLSVILSIIFCLIFFIFAKTIDIKIQDKRLSALFYLTSLVFYILCIPLQFGKAYLSTGWLFESIALICYGVLKKDKLFENSGRAIFVFCFLAFITCDILLYFGTDDFLFKYLLLTLGSITICFVYIYSIKKEKINLNNNLAIFINAALINVWLFLCYSSIYYSSKITFWQDFNEELIFVYSASVIASISMLYGFILLKIKYLNEFVTGFFPQALFLIGTAICLIINLFSINSDSLSSLAQKGLNIETFKNISYCLRIIINIISVLAFREFISRFIQKGRLPFEYLPLTVSVLILCLTVQFSIFQMSISFASMQISFLFMLASALWIYIGFKKLYPSMRRLGLITSFASVAKLFIIDLAFLTQSQRILSYFVFGIVLVIISYIYQHFYRKFELQLEDSRQESQSNTSRQDSQISIQPEQPDVSKQ